MLGFHIGDINKITIFTDIEAMIINAYFGCMDRLGNYDNLSIYENLCKVFADRDRMNRGMAGIYESILVRCANYVGNMGQYLRSNDYSEQGIRLELECERTHVLSTFYIVYHGTMLRAVSELRRRILNCVNVHISLRGI